jgi:uncharacterized membrane protein YhhN
MKTKIVSVIYFLAGFLFIVLGKQSYFSTAIVLKALIIPILMILFRINLNSTINHLDKLMFAGLFFSWAGDVILEFSHRNDDLFIPGLVCFLLAHIMYLTVFFTTPGKNIILRNRVYLLIPVLIYGIGFVYYLYNDLAEMRLPVILYSIVILTMLVGAINRLEKVNRTSYYMVLTGAILFVLSDSSIAINKFGHPFESSGLLIMSTYIVAQYLIIAGYIKQFREGQV